MIKFIYNKAILFLLIISLSACVSDQETKTPPHTAQVTPTTSIAKSNGSRDIGDRGAMDEIVDRTQVPPPIKSSSRRIALVIGNSHYDLDQLQLDNPVNDARAMTATLKSLGFEVTPLENASYTMMKDTVDAFRRRLTQNSEVGLFYFAGHGIKSKSGLNYLIPTDYRPPTKEVKDPENYTAQRSIDADSIRNSMEESKNPLNIIILDACRNDPFATRSMGKRSAGLAGDGLAEMKAPRGTLIAFATSPGDTAADSGGPNGKNGLYTWHLLQNLITPGLDITDVFKNVQRDVATATSGGQRPWTNSSVYDKFVLVPASSIVAEPKVDFSTYQASSSRTVGVEFAMFHDNGTSNPRPLRHGDALMSGDKYFFHIKTANRPENYIYLLQIDSSKKVFKLFPNPTRYQTITNPISANTPITLPRPHKSWVLDKTVGKEKFYLFVSSKPIVVLEEFKNGTMDDVINSGLPLRGPTETLADRTSVAASTGNVNAVVQKLADTDNLTHSFTIEHR